MGLFIKKNNQLVPVGISAEVVDGTDVSDTTAVAADVASGKYFYLANGTKAQGTASAYNGEYHVIIPYNVSISLTNPYDSEYFDSCEIWQINSTHIGKYEQYDDLTLLGTINSPTGSATVQVANSAVSIMLVCNGTGMMVEYFKDRITTTGGARLQYYPEITIPPYPDIGSGSSASIWFEITGDGTITVNNIEWNDD